MLHHPPAVLVVGRDGEATRALIAFLRRNGFAVISAHDGETAGNVIAGESIDCLVTEWHVERIDGRAVMRMTWQRHPEACVVIVVTDGNLAGATDAMREGAYDVQVAPVNHDKLLAVLRRGVAHQALVARIAEIEGQLGDRLALDRMQGHSRSIQRVMEQVRSIAGTRATVLIEGEAGTGKGLVAQAIHRNSPRRGRRFVAIDLSTLAGDAIEGELFGHDRSVVAGASAPFPGRFEMADGGTLFIGEIGEAPAGVQLKLLRVIQDRSVERVGGSETVKVDVRLVVATDRDLGAEVKAGRFREDLLQRLSAVRIRLPALRERQEDIPLLVEVFLREFNRTHRRKVTGVTRGLLDRLTRHAWPGNVRELANTLEGMVAFAEGKRSLDLSDLPAPLRAAGDEATSLQVTVGMTVEEVERQLIAATLAYAGHDKPRAAAILGIGLRTLYRKLDQFKLR